MYIPKIINNTADLFTKKIQYLLHSNLNRAFTIQSDLTVTERVKLYNISRATQAILEIGSYTGASACCFGEALKKSGFGKVICIDTWNNDAMTEGNRDTWQEFQNNTASFKDYIIPVRGFSTDVVDVVAKLVTSVDLLFIDGDHSYEGVKADWEFYKRFLNSGSIVAFHDWGWAEGVRRVIEEDVKRLVIQWDSLPNLWWGSIR